MAKSAKDAAARRKAEGGPASEKGPRANRPGADLPTEEASRRNREKRAAARDNGARTKTQARRDARKASKRAPRDVGRRGEDIACDVLRRRGYCVIERNWKCAAGEADIIARIDDWLVFIEVKTRVGVGCGLPAEAVTASKRMRYEGIASYYIARHGSPESRVRFDVVGVQVLPNGHALVKHIIDAFGTDA